MKFFNAVYVIRIMINFVTALELVFLTVFGFVAGKLAHKTLVAISKAVVGKTKTVLDDLILEYVESPLNLFSIFLVIYLTSLYVAEFNDLKQYVASYAVAVLIVITSYLVSQMVGAVLKWYYVEGQNKRKLMDVTLLPFIRKLSSVLIMVVGISIALSTLGFDVSSIFTFTAVIALLLGLASQETLANIFAGLALQLDRPYTYGDYLKFQTGEVVKLQKIGLRSTKFLDLNGDLMVVSNSEFAKQRVLNLSEPSENFNVQIPVEVPLKTSESKVKEVISSEIKKHKDVFRGTPVFFIDKISKDAYTVLVQVELVDFYKLNAAKTIIFERALKIE